MIGEVISHYKVIEKVGQGGMGVVYRATDLQLDRTVALKFLHPQFATDEEGRQRFIREAKAAAALDHPNICTVYEISETDRGIFIAMAFLDGETLARKIEAGPLRLHEALQWSIQIADVLQAAHEKEIVHRDIKPGNIMVTKKGLAKVMDFGLAQFALQSRLTRAGTTLGTFAYMSPQQAAGEAVDHRTDIWSLGVVLYEMITGQRPFKGEYEQVIAYSILNEEPEPITALRAGLPMELEWIVHKALSADLEDRYQSAEELRVDLRSLDKRLNSGKSRTSWTGPMTAGTQTTRGWGPAAFETGAAGTAAHTTRGLLENNAVSAAEKAQRRERGMRIALIGAVAALLVTLGALVWQGLNPAAPNSEAPLRKFVFTPTEDVDGAVISPDGKYIVYLAGLMTPAARGLPSGAETRLWVRDMERSQVRPMANTENASFPFWSPDSEFIGFRAGRELKKMSVHGGPAVTLCRLPSQSSGGGTWSPDGKSIVFSSFNPPGLYEVPAQGGTASLLTAPHASDGEILASPSMLPAEGGPRALLFGRGSQTQREIVVHNFETEESIVLGAGAYPVYSPSGHIIYQTGPRTAGLWALPFSLESLQPTGEAFPIAQYARGPTVADDGTLVYMSDPAATAQLVWRDPQGQRLGAIGQSQARIVDPALSPDGRFVAVRGWENRESNSDIWIHDIANKVKRRLTFDAEDDTAPLWSPDGQEIAYLSRRSGNLDIMIRAADGRGQARPLVASPQNEYVDDWSADGQYLIYTVAAEETHLDIWYLKRKGASQEYEQAVLLQTPYRELSGKLSPDGRYLAYVSNESGRYEVYVQPFPEGSGKWQVSVNGGGQPRWSRDGKTLFYVQDTTLFSVPVERQPRLSFGSARRLFKDENLLHRFPTPIYDVSADGRRFVLIEVVGPDRNTRASIHLVQNWFAEFAGRLARNRF